MTTTLQCPCGATLGLFGTQTEVDAAARAFEAKHASCPWEVVGVVSERMVNVLRGASYGR